jgi:3-hydroxybutyryl-CoA dehydrogenase
MNQLNWLENVIVVGAGTMGRGIAQVMLEPGYGVTLVDPDEGARSRARGAIREGLDRRDSAQRVEKLDVRPSIPEGESFGFGIEAVPEKLDLKLNVLSDLEPRVTELLATNTSSIPLDELGEDLDRPDRLVGIHFMNPVPVMPLVELIVQPGTDGELIRRGESLVESLDKTPVRVEDSPGFVSNRLLMALINRAIKLVQQEVATPEAVDQIMEMGMGHEMGPIEVADFIGLDVCLETMKIIDRRVEEGAYDPADLLREKVDRGELGQKTGQGFYTYD